MRLGGLGGRALQLMRESVRQLAHFLGARTLPSLFVGPCALLALVASTLVAQDSPLWIPATPPPFARFAVHDKFSGTPAPVDLRSHPDARRFRTVLREGSRAGPNFAGHYTIVTWGCGTNCQQLTIVDSRSGRVYFAPFTVETSIHFTIISRLLAVDPYGTDFTAQELPGPRYQLRFLWSGAALIPSDSVQMVRAPVR